MFKRFFNRSKESGTARRLYTSVVAQARSPSFYEIAGVPDTVEGRFDMIVVHMMLVLRRLRQETATDEGQARLAQALFDTMFADMDTNLREMGVGDLAVPKRIKKMAEAFYGRLSAYDSALDQGDMAALEAAVVRNVYGGNQPANAEVALLSHYIVAADAMLSDVKFSDLRTGKALFPAAPLVIHA